MVARNAHTWLRQKTASAKPVNARCIARQVASVRGLRALSLAMVAPSHVRALSHPTRAMVVTSAHILRRRAHATLMRVLCTARSVRSVPGVHARILAVARARKLDREAHCELRRTVAISAHI